MRRYVLNIDRLYSGETANALVLSQVDEELPTLVPSIGDQMPSDFVRKWQGIYPEFNPPIDKGIEDINDYIIEFNLNLQDEFKKRGHRELYMMDDTQRMKPNKGAQADDKTYLHTLDGKAIDEQGNVEVNSSQMNVLFPYRKMTSKSLYATQLKVRPAIEMD